jgi:nucleolin
VYVEGIPYSATEATLSAFFSDCGTVVDVRMPKYQDSGRPRGYAHVVFQSHKQAAKVSVYRSYMYVYMYIY